MKWFGEAAKNGNSDAMFELGVIYDPSYSNDDKKYIEKDIKKALEWYERAASYGNKKALNRLGDKYNTYNDLFTDRTLSCKEEIDSKKKSMNYYRRAGSTYSAGNVAYYLAGIYMSGREDCKKDVNQAIKYYELAVQDSDRGYSAEASKILANHAFEMKQYEKALKLYLSILENSDCLMYFSKEKLMNILSMEFKVGYLYENGLGTPRNPAKAILYYTRAAEKGLIEAQQNLSILKNKIGSFKPLKKLKSRPLKAPQGLKYIEF